MNQSTLSIISVTPFRGEAVEIEGGEWDIYYRYGPDNWAVRMGESEEPVFDQAELAILESLYQRWRRL